MKFPFIILTLKKYHGITSTCEYLQNTLDEFRTSNISLGEQVRNLKYNYDHTHSQLEDTQKALRKAIHENNQLKKKLK